MTRTRLLTICCALLGPGLGWLSGCIDPYEPAVLASANRFLVVDGFINTTGITTIRLSRSVNLSTPGPPPPEANARLYIEDAAGARLLLRETQAGTYVSAANQLTPGRSYRLHLYTSQNQEYGSDFAAAKATPPIDALRWQADTAGVQVYVDAHDATGQTRYYRWQYEETWAFTSAFESKLQFVNGAISPRSEDIYNCWQSASSTLIKVSSTAALSQDQVRDYRLVQLPTTSDKLLRRYSVLARQYALSRAEYEYLEALKKNTENLGTPFDPLPSQIQGNVHNLAKPAEPVLGFVGVTSLTEKRIFITRAELPRAWRMPNLDYRTCTAIDTALLHTPDYTIAEYFEDPNYRIPVDYIRTPAGLLGYSAQTPECVDCRRRGTNVKPAFW